MNWRCKLTRYEKEFYKKYKFISKIDEFSSLPQCTRLHTVFPHVFNGTCRAPKFFFEIVGLFIFAHEPKNFPKFTIRRDRNKNFPDWWFFCSHVQYLRENAVLHIFPPFWRNFIFPPESTTAHASLHSRDKHKIVNRKNSPVNQLTTNIVPTNWHFIQVTIQTIQIVMNVAVEVMAWFLDQTASVVTILQQLVDHRLLHWNVVLQT